MDRALDDRYDRYRCLYGGFWAQYLCIPAVTGMSAKDFNQAEKEKVEFKVVSEESTAGYALARVNGDCPQEPVQPENEEDSSKPAQEDANQSAGKGFEKLELIGTGAMGAVWKVRERASGKIFAIKYIIPELASDPNTRRRFEQEAKVAVELHHPNLAAVYGSGIDEDRQPYIQMQYVEGESLAKVLAREGKLSEDRAEDIFNQICEALKYLHAHGIIHRDIKPSNIIIGKTAGGADVVSVTDFGISKSIYEDVQPTHALTQTSDVLGSFLYSSPEQCLGEDLTASSDIYSLGCVFFEMLTGKPPFDEKNSVKLIMKQMSEYPDYEKVPPKFRLILTYCFFKDPRSRARSVENLIEINKNLSFGGSQYSYVALQTLPYVIGFMPIVISSLIGYDGDNVSLILNSGLQACSVIILWLFIVIIAREHSIKSDFLDSACAALLASVPITFVSGMMNSLEASNAFLACVIPYLVLTKYFKDRSISRLLWGANSFSSSSKNFLIYGAKFGHYSSIVLAFFIFLTSVIEAVPVVINFSAFDSVSAQAATATFFIGSLLTLFYIHLSHAGDSLLSKLKRTARFSAISLGVSAVIVFISTALLWTSSTAFIVRCSTLMFQKNLVAKSIPSEIAALPHNGLGNYARIVAIQKLVREKETPEIAFSIANDIIKSEKEPSEAKAMAYGYRYVLNRRNKGSDATAEADLKQCLIGLSQAKSDIDVLHPKILLANSITFNFLKFLPGDCLYYTAQAAFRNGDFVDAKKVIAAKKRLGISCNLPSYFRILQNKIED